MKKVFKVHWGSARFCPDQKQSLIPEGMAESYGFRFFMDTGKIVYLVLTRPTTPIGLSTIIYAVESALNDGRKSRKRMVAIIQLHKGDVDENN
jgi:hypothetical protein